MGNYTMPTGHKPTPTELAVRKILDDELYDHPDVDTNSIAFRIMVAIGEVIPESSYLHYIRKEQND